MNHAATCKICHKPLVIQVADDYVGDPLKILPMATCNRCYDLRERRIRLEEALFKTCYGLVANPKAKDSVRGAIHATLVELTKKYSQWFGEANNLSGHLWEEQFVDMLMAKPNETSRVLSEYRRVFSEAVHKPPPPPPARAMDTPSLPYKDA